MGSHGLATDPRLTVIVDTWPSLPEHVKAAVLALVEGASR
jgi:hypothetical protein